MAPKPTILILLLVVSIATSPLRGLMHSHTTQESSNHAHHHVHDDSNHAHHHQHDGDEAFGQSLDSTAISAIDHKHDAPILIWMALRRIEVAMPALDSVMAVLSMQTCREWLPNPRVKPPPWLPCPQSSQTNQLRTVVLLV